MNQSSLVRTVWCVFKRDLTVALRRVTDVFTPLVFFAIVVSLFPLGVGPEAAMLRALPGVVWVAALLAAMLPRSTACSPTITPTLARSNSSCSRPIR